MGHRRNGIISAVRSLQTSTHCLQVTQYILGQVTKRYACYLATCTRMVTATLKLLWSTDRHAPAQQISLECGEIGRQANGAVMLTMGKTVSTSSCAWDLLDEETSTFLVKLVFAQSCIPCLQGAHDPQAPPTASGSEVQPGIHRYSNGLQMLYATACCSSEPAGDGSFLPMTVNYSERFSATGRTTWVSVSAFYLSCGSHNCMSGHQSALYLRVAKAAPCFVRIILHSALAAWCDGYAPGAEGAG